MDKIIQSKFATGKFAQGFIRACVRVGDSFQRMVVGKINYKNRDR